MSDIINKSIKSYSLDKELYIEYNKRDNTTYLEIDDYTLSIGLRLDMDKTIKLRDCLNQLIAENNSE